MNNVDGDSSRYKPLKLDEAVPVRCECCEPSRKIQSVRTGPTSVLYFCPTTRAAYLPKRDRATDRRYLIRGFYRGDVD